jgi:polyhydroxyalkanoate synthesis regulator phasin
VAETLGAKGCLNKNDTKRLLDEVIKKLEETKTKTTQHLIKRGTNGQNCKKSMQTATMKTQTPPGVWDIKQVEMTKLKKFVPYVEKLKSSSKQ